MPTRENPIITTMLELLERLCLERLGSRKTSAKVEHYRMPRILRVVECFDDGKGHSGSFTSEKTNLDLEIFTQARQKGYILGILKQGQAVEHEFSITELGTKKLLELREKTLVPKEPVAPASEPSAK